MQKQSRAILHQHCHFPTAIRRDIKESQYRIIGIFDLEDTVTASEQDRQPPRDLVLTVWAILLRYYVRNDIVAFLTLCESLGHCYIASTISKSCFGEDIEAVMLQYQLFDNLLLHDIRASEPTKCTDLEMGDMRISTMVRFSSLCATSSLQGNEMHSLSTRVEDAVAMNNVRLLFTAYHQDSSHKLKLL